MRTATVSHTIKVILVIARPQTESRSDGIQLGSSKSPGPMSIPPSARKAGWSPTLPPFTSLTEPLHDHVQRRAGTEHQADQEPDVLRYAEPPVDQRPDPGANAGWAALGTLLSRRSPQGRGGFDAACPP